MTTTQKKTGDRVRFRKRELFHMLGYEPHAAQLAVHKSTARRRVVAFGARGGKSTCAAMEAVAALLEPNDRCLGWLVGPTYDLTDRIFTRVCESMLRQFAHRIVHMSEREHRIVVRNLGAGLSELRAKSADKPASLLGESLSFLVVDEAASIRDGVWEEYLAPRLIDRDGWLLLVSTPHGRGWFYEQFRRGQKARDAAYASWQAPTTQNPHVPAALIEAERKRLDADRFAEQYEARFLGPPDPCDKCGGPSPDVGGYAVEFDDEPLPRCSMCGDYVYANGRTRVKLSPDGKRRMTILCIARSSTSLSPQEVKNLQGFDDPAATSAPADAAAPVP
jgi:hypothetical protein